MTRTPTPLGLCERAEARKADGKPLLWDGRWDREPDAEVQARHTVARLECARCPRLDDCEAILSEHEKLGEPIDGVVAGRYSDCVSWDDPKARRQTHCRACREKMIPQGKAHKGHYISRHEFHAGEGMCSKCHRMFSRSARRGAA